MEHKCSKEKEIDKVSAAIFGNGKKGLVTITERLSDQIGYLTKSTDSIKTDVKVLLQFQTQVETREKGRHEYEEKLVVLETQQLINKRWRVGLLITTVLSLVGIFFTFIMFK